MGAVSSYPTDPADSTDFVLGTNAAGDVKRFLMSALRNVWRTVYVLTAAHSNSTTTSTTITDGTTAWSHSVVAGKTYRFSVTGTYQTAALTTGMRMSVLPTNAVGSINGFGVGAIAQAAGSTGLEVTLFAPATSTTVWPTGSSLLTTAVNPINSPHHVYLEFIYRCTTSGTIALQFASEVATSAAQLNLGSALVVEELN